MKLIDIPARSYTGYVWLSNAQEPIVLENETYDFSKVGLNPFVIEALLWNEEEQVSVMVRHSGRYYIQEFRLKEFEQSGELVEKKYLPHRLDASKRKIQYLKFRQFWLPEPDALCEGMNVLIMKALVFTGFEFAKN
jgi:CRISPR type III-associated protein (TIGR04423 family)